jgi:hypothetical protein
MFVRTDGSVTRSLSMWHSEAVALLGVVEADDCPSVVSAGASNALDAVVAVLEDQPAIAIGRNHRRGLPNFMITKGIGSSRSR